MNTYAWPNKPVLLPPIESGPFTSWAFTQRLYELGLVPSMGTIGDCYDCEHNRRVIRLTPDPCIRLARVPWR